MKQTLLLLIFILSYNTSAATKWIKVDSVKSNSGRYDIACFGESSCAYAFAKTDTEQKPEGLVAYQSNIIRYTADKGKTWKRIFFDSINFSTGFDFAFRQIDFFNENTIVALTNKGYMFKTTNLGKTWDTLKYEKKTGNTFSLRTNENGQGFFRLTGVLYLTDDFGKTWTTLQHPPDRDDVPMIYGGCDRFQDTIIMNAIGSLSSQSDYNYSKVSYDKGQTWEYYDGVKARLINQKFINGKIGFRTGSTKPSMTSEPSVIYKTTNTGKTWELVRKTDKRVDDYYEIAVIDYNNIIVSAANNIVISTDQGNTWKDITTPELYKLKRIKEVAASSLKNMMLFNIKHGIYNLNYTSSVEDKTFSKENIAVFPNPVRHSEALNITLPESMNGQANITILNMLGQQLYRMSDTYTNQMNFILPNNLSSGNYIIQIEMNNKTYSKTFIVAE